MAQVIDGIARSYKHNDTGIPAHVQEKWTGLSDLSHYLATSDNLEDLVESASRHIADILDVDLCQIILVDLNGHYRCRAVYSRSEPMVVMGEFMDPEAVEGVCNRLLDPENNARFFLAHEHLSEQERISLGIKGGDLSWIIPMRVESSGIGVLILGQSSNNEKLVLSEDSYYLVDLIADQLASAIYRTQMNDRLELLSIETVIVLSKTLETRDLHSASHSKRMAALSEQMAHQYRFSVRETRELCWAALLHDIGKIGVEDTILKKEGPLTEKEWEIMRTHPGIGAQIVGGVSGLEKIAPLINAHHERMDGKGYPQGLMGEEIPLGARILAVADSYTTMTDGRPYQKKCTHDEALQELLDNTGTAYDPEVVKIFISLFDGNIDSMD